MGYDGKILRRALQRRREERALWEDAQEKRRQKIYQSIPRLLEIDHMLRQTMFQVIKEALEAGDDPTKAINEIRAKNQSLQEEQRQLLQKYGWIAARCG